MFANAILLLYSCPPVSASAPTIMEHVNAFEKYSKNRVIKWNTALGFPRQFANFKFQIIVLHYSLFAFHHPYEIYSSGLNKTFFEFIKKQLKTLKVAFFQDEHQYVPQRFRLINSLGIDLVYTLLERDYHYIYYRNTVVKEVFFTLTGYVDDQLIGMSAKIGKPMHERSIDVGYRARPLPYWMGRGALEKTEIARAFIQNSRGLKLVLDIKTEEQDRIYGEKWHHFVANCRAMIGVEAGVTVFDFEDKVRPAVEAYTKQNPKVSFDEIEQRFFAHLEDRIRYRTISPRIFEMAAMKVVQILFEGEYQGIMAPEVHYIPLKKDFTNFDLVIRQLRDNELVYRLTEKAYADLIQSGTYAYPRFISQFDAQIQPYLSNVSETEGDIAALQSSIDRFASLRMRLFALKAPLHKTWPGKSLVKRGLLAAGLIKRA